MHITSAQLAGLLNGRLIGAPDIALNDICKLNEGKPGAISFLGAAQYEPFIYTTTASVVLVAEDFVPKQEVSAAMIVVPEPYKAFVTILEYYAKLLDYSKTGVEEPSFIGQGSTVGQAVYRAAFSYIGDGCTIGNNVKIHAHAYVGDKVTLGDDVIIQAGAKVLPNTVVGKGCVINAGAVIGGPGFGYQPQADGSYKAVPQLGNVVLEDYVEIGANTTIDRATMGSTVIKKGVKLDNLVQVAHNVTIGSHTVMASQSGIAGSTTLGSNCVIGGQVGFADHLTIANGSKFGAQTGVHQSIETEDLLWMGSPMMKIKEYMRSVLHVQKLDTLQRRVSQLERKLAELETEQPPQA